MRRLYFLLPNVEATRALVGELRRAGVAESHLHAVAGASVPLEGLPKATALETSELRWGLEHGLGVGGAAGLLGGLLAVTFPPAGLIIGGEALLAIALAGAGFGGLVSALVAKDIPNHELEAFEAGIAKGQILLLVDVPPGEVERFRQLILSSHPEAVIGEVAAKSAAGGS